MADQLTYIVLSVHSRAQYDTREHFRECVRTLEANTTNYRLIFVDDWCDTEGSNTIRDVARRHPESYIIRTEKQRWFTRAFNLGLRLVRTSPSIILNSDTVLGPGWLEELYAVKAEAEATIGSHVGLVGSEFSEPEQRRWQHITTPSTPGNPGYVTGHCILLDMQAAFECSMDRGMPGFYLDETKQENIHIRSDNEICYRMHKLGWNTIRSFKSAVGHHGGKSWGHDLGKLCGLTLESVND